jgi:hypothetical protein
MKYMLMMHHVDLGVAPITEWSGDDVKAHMEFMHSVNRDLAGAGELVDCQGLAWPDQAKIVRAAADGTPAVTDGPFPEAKEFLAGYWIVECPGVERAVAIAAHISTAPGPDGVPLNMPIEVREVPALPS